MNNKPNKQAKDAPPQAAPMAVTLGNGRNQAQAAAMVGSQKPSPSDVLMEEASTGKAPATTPGEVNMAGVVETLEVNGEIPQARFGHTITIVSKSKVVLFGGATGDTGKYSMTGETFMYNVLNKAW